MKKTQELASRITESENALSEAKEQIKTFEVSTKALTDFIQHQQTALEAEKQQLIAQIQAYEEDPQLENEQKLNQKLAADLTALTDAIASYEKQLGDLEQRHGTELQEALQEAAIQKFELAEARLLAEINEQELISVSTT